MTTSNRAACGVSSALAMLGVAAALHGQPVVLYVDDDAPGGGDGSSWQQAFRDLQDALAVANAVDYGSFEIRIAEGVYRPDRGTLDQEEAFHIGPKVPITASAISVGVGLFGGFVGLRGSDPDARDPDRLATVLTGDLKGDDGPDWARREDNSFCVVRSRYLGLGLVLDGLTITAGHAPAQIFFYAAGLDLYEPGLYPTGYATATLRNCRIVGNDVLGFAWAAGASIYARQVLIEDSLIAGNAVRRNPSPGSTTIGVGGIEVLSSLSDVEITNTRFLGNHGLTAGGAHVHGSRVVTRCEFAGNSAHGFGGGFSGSVLPTLVNCLFAENSAELGGGGFYSEIDDSMQVFGGFDARIIGCTFIGNRAAYGGAVFAQAYAGLLVVNSIISGNEAPLGPSLVLDSPGMAVQVRDSLVQGGPSAVYGFWRSLEWRNVLDTDPLFRDAAGPDGDPATWQDNDYHLLISSPCIDMGDPDVPYGVMPDLDGATRAVDSDPAATRPRPDLGAYEVQDPWCPADFNGDGFVDGIDYDRFGIDFDTGSPRADVNRDGYVDGIDYDQFAIWFNSGC